MSTAVLIAAGSLLWLQLPDAMEVEAPFDVTGAAGNPVSGRDIVLTVAGVRFASSVRAMPRPAVAAVGRWVVIEAELVARASYAKPRTELLVGGNTYIPSNRFILVGLGGELSPGITQHGSWIFDVAPALLDHRAPLALRVWTGDGRLDSRLVVSVPYPDAGPAEPTVTVEPVRSSV